VKVDLHPVLATTHAEQTDICNLAVNAVYFTRDGQKGKEREIGMADLPKRNQIQPGMQVLIVEKHNQRSGLLTEGVVARILTKSPAHPHGIKVKLEDGKVGRVQRIVDPRRD
jgi:uncharacterized repeat protein (TIGR03833 family)